MDDDRTAILAVLRAETDAWMRRDFEALASHWVHSSHARRMVSLASLGADVDEGWDVIAARMKHTLEQYPKTYETESRLRWERVNVVVGNDMAWVSYDQVGIDTGDDFELAGVQHELKIFHRIDGVWKIACLAIMQQGIEHAACPLIEIDEEARVLWMNRQAKGAMADHPGLLLAAGRLRARRRAHEPDLREAIAWAAERLRLLLPMAKQSRLVPLGEDDTGVPSFCWVIVDDGKALVSFDDRDMVQRRLDTARMIYGLSAAQVRLATHLAEGRDLVEAAKLLGVSVNTVRTHLTRMFERTGTHSQTGLMRTLLTADVPQK